MDVWLLSQTMSFVVYFSVDIANLSESVEPDGDDFQLSWLSNGPRNFGSSWFCAAAACSAVLVDDEYIHDRGGDGWS